MTPLYVPGSSHQNTPVGNNKNHRKLRTYVTVTHVFAKAIFTTEEHSHLPPESLLCGWCHFLPWQQKRRLQGVNVVRGSEETVESWDSRNQHLLLLMEEILHQLIGSISHYLQGFIHPRWCKISAINNSRLRKRSIRCFCSISKP